MKPRNFSETNATEFIKGIFRCATTKEFYLNTITEVGEKYKFGHTSKVVKNVIPFLKSVYQDKFRYLGPQHYMLSNVNLDDENTIGGKFIEFIYNLDKPKVVVVQNTHQGLDLKLRDTVYVMNQNKIVKGTIYGMCIFDDDNIQYNVNIDENNSITCLEFDLFRSPKDLCDHLLKEFRNYTSN